jgi:phospholipid transport system substrate-binding protein
MRAILWLLLILLPWPAAASENDPAATVRRFSEALLTAMKQGPALGYKGRVTLLAPAVEDLFAVPTMAGLALGPNTGRLTPEQSQRLVGAFRQWTVANYASQFAEWNGERFEVDPPLPTGDAVVVPSRIVPRHGDVIRLDYVMREIDGRQRAVDVLLQGSVSQMAVRRSEFVSVVRRQGFDALIDLLEQRTAALAQTE